MIRFEVSAEWMCASRKGDAAQVFDIVGVIDFPEAPQIPRLVTVNLGDDIGWVVSHEHGKFVRQEA